MTDVRTPEMYLHEGTIGSDGKHCDSARCWCWDEFAATVEARTLDKRCPECDNGQYCGIGPCPKCHPEAYVTSKERNLPALLRAAERRVNDFVFNGAPLAVARIPADRDHDLDLLLCAAADEIERLTRERDEERIMHAEVDAALKCEADERERLTREYEAYQREASSENDRLRTALETVRSILGSESVEYDDLRNIDQTIDAALSGEPAFTHEHAECSDPEHVEAMRHLASIMDTEAERDRLSVALEMHDIIERDTNSRNDRLVSALRGMLHLYEHYDQSADGAAIVAAAREALNGAHGADRPAPETFAGTPWVNGPPKEPGSHVVHYESGYYAVLTLTADSMVLRSRRNDNPYGIVRHFRFDVSAQKARGEPT